MLFAARDALVAGIATGVLYILLYIIGIGIGVYIVISLIGFLIKIFRKGKQYETKSKQLIGYSRTIYDYLRRKSRE